MPDLSAQERPPGYELFFAPLVIQFDPNTAERISFAYICSKYGHAKQLRDDGSRGFDHPKAAVWIYIDEFGGADPEIMIDILLHDLSEDQYLLSPYRIRLNFGSERAFDIRALTKLPKGKETTEQYLGRIIDRGHRTIVAKLTDRLHNLRTLAGRPPEKRREQIEETTQFHLPMLIKALKACGDPEKLAEPLEAAILEAIRYVTL